ncbi:MAG: hypothetical protein Q4D71_08555 [Oscillospiraceae bacterium]|nr:hypothetical protein [Oscillospiraceae bacterium]
MNSGLKILLLIALLMYVISPVDCVPGPVDDMILILVYAVMNRRKAGPVDLISEKNTSQN